MTKNELKSVLQVKLGELKADLENEDGVFDEIAVGAFKDCLNCKEILCKDSKDTLVQLDKSVLFWFLDDDIIFGQENISAKQAEMSDEDIEENVSPIYVDGVFLSTDKDVMLTCSYIDGSDVFSETIDELPREVIFKVIEEIENEL